MDFGDDQVDMEGETGPGLKEKSRVSAVSSSGRRIAIFGHYVMQLRYGGQLEYLIVSYKIVYVASYYTSSFTFDASSRTVKPLLVVSATDRLREDMGTS